MKLPIVVLLAAVAATLTYIAVKQPWVKKDIDAVEREFQHFVKRWGKVYASEEEKLHRLEAFRDNFWYVMHENNKGNTYELELNEFADQTPDEFAATHFGLKPKKMWGSVPHLGTHKFSGKTPPAAADWTKKGAVTPVKNQGQCGSCWSFSTTGSLEGALEIATGKLVSLSEQQFVDCSKDEGNQGCNGGLMDNAFQYAEKAAICTESSYPYKAKGGTCEASSCEVGLPKGSVTGFKDVHPKDMDAMMEAVAQQPVSIAIEADQRAFQLYKKGVLTGTCGAKLDHGVLAVGYGTMDGTDYWKVKNSWGGSWGMEGYVLIEKGKPKQSECGILMQPSYPVVSGKPGPSPGPSPPPPPPSPPSPSTSHYEKPPCQDDEMEASVEGADGSLCSPKCNDDGSCPTDVPDGTTDKPKCVLQDQSGDQYCALTCVLGGCPPGAKCAHPGGLEGICVFPSDEKKQKTLKLNAPSDKEMLGKQLRAREVVV